ncbi:hypothetical protein PQQ63_38185, partial [Paraburkholderia metrosideri]
AKKVSAAPHRGDANRPLTNQAKAKTIKTQTSATQAKKPGKDHRHRQTNKQSAKQANPPRYMQTRYRYGRSIFNNRM